MLTNTAGGTGVAIVFAGLVATAMLVGLTELAIALAEAVVGV